jgi:hypothetical protein
MTDAGTVILGRADADGTAHQKLQRHPGAVRFADPAVWATALATLRALRETDLPWDGWSDEIGMITVSADGPRQVILQVAEGALAGFMSALRFPAASPGTLAGFACILGRLRGPTLNLTLPPVQGVPVGWAQMGRWLEEGVIHAGILATCAYGMEGPVARCAVLARGPMTPEQGEARAEAMRWLAATPDVGSPPP